jgi:hypothetical protein
MSKARLAEVSYDDAAIAFGCTVATMQQHYLVFDKARVADDTGRDHGHAARPKWMRLLAHRDRTRAGKDIVHLIVALV